MCELLIHVLRGGKREIVIYCWRVKVRVIIVDVCFYWGLYFVVNVVFVVLDSLVELQYVREFWPGFET